MIEHAQDFDIAKGKPAANALMKNPSLLIIFVTAALERLPSA